ncbi:MAG: peroxiredoxin family protein [Pseudomonadota bacterium]|uniref:peroxiredoxin family protein n=1 Tax=Thermithiobacillus tepidarius TaxID=929 RepID=UPI0003F64F3C|nr:redoxin domain-containing protein [Thermithiobacillus tepidarius]
MIFPSLRSVIPSFTLPDIHEHQTALGDYRQRQPVVLLFWDGDESLLHDFARHYPAYQALGAEVLAVGGERPPAGEWPFPVLVDHAGAVSARYVERTPAVLVLDRFGELYAGWQGPWPAGPEHRDILGWVRLTELQCPECGAPDLRFL